MDKQVSKWIIEFLIRQRVDDSLLDRLIARLPLEDADYRVKKGLLLRRIQTEISKGIVSEMILDLLELVGELEFCERKSPSEAMKTAYCSVALDCTVRYLEVEDNRMYLETLQRIWRGRVQKMANSENCGLVSEKLLSWRDDLESASSIGEIRDKILSRNTRYEALKAVRGYLADSWSEMGPSFLEKTAADVYKMNALGERQGLEGLESVTEAGKGDNVVDEKQSGDVLEAGRENNVIEKERCLEGLENVMEAASGDDVRENGQGLESVMDACVGPPADTQGCEGLENVTEGGKEGDLLEKEQGLENVIEARDDTLGYEGGLENVTEGGKKDELLEKEQGLENVIETHDGMSPSDSPSAETQHKKGLSRRKHVGVRRKMLYGRGSKAKISNDEDVAGENENQCFSTPEVNKMTVDLQSSFADLNAAVKDPLPEALKIAEDVSSNLQKDTGVGGNCGTEMNVDSTPMDKRNRLGADNVANIRGDVCPERDEGVNENQSVTSDPLEFTEESSPSRLHLRSPKRRRITPLKAYQSTKLERRRQPRKWSVLEEDTLRKGVQEFGRGNWKVILREYRDILEERTEVDLKDKWRNLTRFSR